MDYGINSTLMALTINGDVMKAKRNIVADVSQLITKRIIDDETIEPDYVDFDEFMSEFKRPTNNLNKEYNHEHN